MTTVLTVFAVLLSASLARGQSTGRPLDLASEVESLKKALAETQKQVTAQQREIEALKNGPKSATMPAENGQQSKPAVQAAPNPQSSSASTSPSSETAFRIGSLLFTPGGFLDFENIYRTTNTQSNIATNFGAIPYNNTEQGNISEFRSTVQFSRLNLKISSIFGKHDITAYLETDFSGNSAPNVYQSVNGHTNRLRLFFGDGKLGKWQIALVRGS